MSAKWDLSHILETRQAVAGYVSSRLVTVFEAVSGWPPGVPNAKQAAGEIRVSSAAADSS